VRRSKSALHALVLALDDAASVLALMCASRTLMRLLLASDRVRSHVRSLRLAAFELELQHSAHTLRLRRAAGHVDRPALAYPSAPEASCNGAVAHDPLAPLGAPGRGSSLDFIDGGELVRHPRTSLSMPARDLHVDWAGLRLLDQRLNLALDQRELAQIFQWDDVAKAYVPLSAALLDTVVVRGPRIVVDMPRVVQKFNHFGRAYCEQRTVAVTVLPRARPNCILVVDVLEAFLDNNRSVPDVDEDSGISYAGIRMLSTGHFELRFGRSNG
jgi:hypothetical protein